MVNSTNNIQDTITRATTHYRDVNSKDIFENKLLSSQFLRDYTNLPIFSDIGPEDIEDVTNEFTIYLGVRIEGDTIKKVSAIPLSFLWYTMKVQQSGGHC